ncbi:MAG: class I SAM-dependent methyltransferase [Acidimicrobiales bacterium]
MARYRVSIDFSEPNDSRVTALTGVPARSLVLDIGVGDGSVGRTLRQMGCRVFGVEMDESLAAGAADAYEHVVVADAERLDPSQAFSGMRFDVVLLLDVLEHLRNPEEVLARIHSVLADRGFVIVSVPNITHAAVKLQLLDGRFTYTEEGLLDSTHVHFFDIASLTALFAATGFEIMELDRVTRPPEATEIPVDLGAVPPGVIEAVHSDPEAETYQFVATAAPTGSRALVEPLLLPARILQARVRELAAERDALVGGGGRPWLNPPTISWIDEQVEQLRIRSEGHRQAIWDLLSSFRETSQKLSEQIALLGDQPER